MAVSGEDPGSRSAGPFARYHRSSMRATALRRGPILLLLALAAAFAVFLSVTAPPDPPVAAALKPTTIEALGTGPMAASPPPTSPASPPAAPISAPPVSPRAAAPQPAAAPSAAPPAAAPPAAQAGPVAPTSGPPAEIGIPVTATGYQAELDRCQWVRMDLGIPEPIVGAHTNCGGSVVLALKPGQRVRLSGQSLDGTYFVTGSRDAYGGEEAATATRGLVASVLLQTCYPGATGRERLVTLTRLR